MAARQYLRRNLFLCAVLHGFNHYLLIFFKPLYPEMAAYFNLHSVYELTTRLTLAYFGYGLSNLFTGIFAARLNLKKLLFWGMCLMSLSTILMAFVGPSDYPLAVILIFFMGLGGGVYHPAANTMITNMAEERRGRSLGALSVGSALGFVLAPLIGTYVGSDLIGFKMLFLGSGLLALLFSLVFIFFL